MCVYSCNDGREECVYSCNNGREECVFTAAIMGGMSVCLQQQ